MRISQLGNRLALLVIIAVCAVALHSTLLLLNMGELDKWLAPFGNLAGTGLGILIVATAIATPWTGSWLLVAGSNFFDPVLGWLVVLCSVLFGNWLAYEIAHWLLRPIHGQIRPFVEKLNLLVPVYVLLYALPLFPIAMISWLLGGVGYARKTFWMIVVPSLTVHTVIVSFLEEHIYTDNYQWTQLFVFGMALVWLVIMVWVYPSKSTNQSSHTQPKNQP